MSSEWDSERLAALIERRRPLYDYHLKDHSNKQVIEKLWREVAKEMNSTVLDCKTKWTSMRNSYARHLRDITVAACGGTTKRKWYLADCMAFLDEFMAHRRRVSANFDVVQPPIEDTLKEEQDDQLSGRSVKVEERPRVIVQDYSQYFDREVQQEVQRPPSVEIPEDSTETDLLFFRSLLADMNKLSGRRKRKFKEMVMSSLNSMVDAEEDEARFRSVDSSLNN